MNIHVNKRIFTFFVKELKYHLAQLLNSNYESFITKRIILTYFQDNLLQDKSETIYLYSRQV